MRTPGTLLRPSLTDVLPQNLGTPRAFRDLLQRGMPHWARIHDCWQRNKDTFYATGSATVSINDNGDTRTVPVGFSLIRTTSTKFIRRRRHLGTDRIEEFYLEQLPYTPAIVVMARNEDGSRLHLPEDAYDNLQSAARMCLDGALPREMRVRGSCFPHRRHDLEDLQHIGDTEDIGSIWKAADQAARVQTILNRNCPRDAYLLRIRPCMARHIILAAGKVLAQYPHGIP